MGRFVAGMEGDRFQHFVVVLLHLLCRALSADDFDVLHKHLVTIDAKIVHAPEPGGWTPGYYSVFFEDPVGTRLELNFVPGKGVLADDAGFNPSGDYQ